MLVERGRVTSTPGPGRVVVSIHRPASCGSCAARGACMTLGPTERRIEVLDPVGAAEGDEVEIGLPPARVVWASTIAYLMPVGAMLAGGLAGYALAPGGDPDLGAATFAFVGLALAGFVIWLHGRLASRNEAAMPKVVRVVAADGGVGAAVDTDCSVS